MTYKNFTIIPKLLTKQNVNLNYNVNGGKNTSDGTLSAQPNLNLNNSKEFPSLPTNVSHPQDSKDKLNYYKKNHYNANMFNTQPDNNLISQFSSFLSELKLVINPLIQLLTTVINKLILKYVK